MRDAKPSDLLQSYVCGAIAGACKAMCKAGLSLMFSNKFDKFEQ